MEKKYIVRYYDGSDRDWSDSTGPLSREEAERELAKRTKNGTQNTCYADGDYFDIFPANTRMLFTCGDSK